MTEKLIRELRKRNPYPIHIFAKTINDVKYWKKVNDALKGKGLSPDAVFGAWGRHVWNNCIDEIERIEVKQ